MFRPDNRGGARFGAVAPLVAFSLVGLLGVVAIALEGGMAMDSRRRVQAAADGSALAAATDLFKRYNTSAGQDPQGYAAQSAKTTAAANGFTHGVDGTTVTVRTAGQTALLPSPENLWSTSSGLVKSGYVEVTIEARQRRYFSAIFGEGDLPISARAVAQGSSSPQTKPAIVVLEPDQEFSLRSSGNGTLTVLNGGVMVNTSHPNSMQHSGNATLSAQEWNFASDPGYVPSGSGTLTGTINKNAPPLPDPLRDLQAPTDNYQLPDGTVLPIISRNKFSVSDDTPTIMEPGVYMKGIQFSGSGAITMKPGIYYIDGGGFQISGQSTLTANGVMIFNTGSGNGHGNSPSATPSDAIQISGNGAIDWTPPTTGPYAGISIFQERSIYLPLNLSGNGQTKIAGTVYAANGMIQVSGSSEVGQTTRVGTQFISRTMQVSGDSSITLGFDAGTPSPPTKTLRLVE